MTEKERVKKQNKKINLALGFRQTVMWQHCWGKEKSNPTGWKCWRVCGWGVWMKRKHSLKCSGEGSTVQWPDVRNREAALRNRQCRMFLQPLRVKERESLRDTRLRIHMCKIGALHTLARCASRLPSPIPCNVTEQGKKGEERIGFQNPQSPGRPWVSGNGQLNKWDWSWSTELCA